MKNPVLIVIIMQADLTNSRRKSFFWLTRASNSRMFSFFKASDWWLNRYLLDWLFCLVVLSLNALSRIILVPHEVYFRYGDYSQSYPHQSDTVPAWILPLLILVL